MAMSRGHQLNEAEINEFLARSESEDDSDWDNIGEVDAEELLRPNGETSKPTAEKKSPPVKKVVKKKVVSYRQISDIGVDILFGPQPGQDGKADSARRTRTEEEEEEEGSLNSTGAFVQEKLRAKARVEDESRVEREIRWQERLEVKQKPRGDVKAQPTSKPEVKGSTSVGLSAAAKIAEGSRKDYFIPSGTSVRVVKPRISAQTWEDRIFGRKVCKLSGLRPQQVEEMGNSEWLTVGVVVYPPDVRRSKGGTGPPYSIWRLSDLDDLDRLTSLFIFGGAHHQLWKEAGVGLVVALLRPRQFSSSGEGAKADEVTLTVDNAQQALILGQSKDFGTCSSRTKAGAMCQRIVNLSLCEYCEFHVRQLYRTAGNQRSGFSQAIGAQAKRLANGLDGRVKVRARRSAPSLPTSSQSQLRVLQRLGGPGASNLMSHMRASAGLTTPSAVPPPPPPAAAAAAAAAAAPTTSAKTNPPPPPAKSAPVLSSFNSFFKTFQERETPSAPQGKIPRLSDPTQDLARARAAAKIRAAGGVAKMQAEEKKRQVLRRLNSGKAEGSGVLPSMRKSLSSAPDIFPVGKPRTSETCPAEEKRRRLLKSVNCQSEEELVREIARGSQHTQLVATEEQAQEERHFRALEFREKYEDKLASVREHKVKVVSCSLCHYRAEGHTPNPQCAAEHPAALRFGHGHRRYFVCNTCRERTTSLEKIPTRNCKKCGGSNFERTGMLKERKGPRLVHETLQTRGEEHAKFLNS